MKTRSLLAQLLTDAVELTRAHGLGKSPEAKAVVRQVLTNDSFQLLTMTRVRGLICSSPVSSGRWM